MTKIIAMMGRKGGSTKSTMSINIAAACARAGLRTVLVDSDGQANATTSVRVAPHDGFYNLIAQDLAFSDVLVPVPNEFHGHGELYLLAASDAIRTLEGDEETSAAIYESFQDLRGAVDVVIVDTSPGITEVHNGFYFTADYVLLPTLCEFTSINSLTTMLDYLQGAALAGQEQGFTAAQILGIVPNRFNASEKVQQVNIGFLRGRHGLVNTVFPQIRNLTVWGQASQLRKSIYAYADDATDYNARRQAKMAMAELQPVLDEVLDIVRDGNGGHTARA